MTTVPIRASIHRAYRFAFRGFFYNLGIVWAPVLLVAGLMALVVPHMLSGLARMMTALTLHPAHGAVLLAGGLALFRDALLLGVAILFVRAQIMTGLTRRALGLQPGFVPVYLSFGAAFWRVFGAFALVWLLLLAFQVVATLVLALLASIFLGTMHGAAPDAASFAVHAGVGFFVVALRLVLGVVQIYLIIRLSFLLTAVIVAEERFDVIRAWRLTEGNVARIFVIGIAVFVPILVLMAICYGLVFGGAMFSAAEVLAHSGSHHVRDGADTVQRLGVLLLEVIRRRWYVLLPMLLLGTTLEYGLAAGAGVAGYDVLKEKLEPEAAVAAHPV